MTTMPNYTPDVEAAAQRVKELSDRLVDLTKKNGLSWLEAYERVLDSILRFEQQAASGSQVEWINTLATTHADFVREMSQVYVRALREQLK